MLLGEDGTVLAHTRAIERGKRYVDPQSLRAAQSTGPLLQRYETVDGGPVYDFAVPVYVLDQRRATARVALSIEHELAQIARTRNVILVIGATVLALGLAWTTRRAKRIVRPVEALVAGTREIGRGNLSHRITVDTGDELGQLALAFNRMTDSVQALMETSRDLSSTLDPDEVLRSIAAHALKLVKADLAAIAPFAHQTQEARVAVTLGTVTDRLQHAVVTPGRGIGGAVLATGRPLITGNYLDDPEIVHDPAYDAIVQAERIRATVAVPITVKDKIAGVLWVANRRNEAFTAEDVDTLRRMSHQAAIALENATLYHDLRRSHEQLLAAQTEMVGKTRLAAMGEIAAVVAHEARNPLGALSNCVQLLRRNPHITGEDAELLEIIHTESQRLNEIVSDFLAFGRPRPPQFESVDIHEALEATLAALRRDSRCPQAIVFVTKFDPAMPPARADRDQLAQVFWNLFLNAVQAMGDQGELKLETRNEGAHLQVCVQDTGSGIVPEAQERIFEPFYTTRAGGTGLGLAIVRRIIVEHGGEIRLDSEPGVGTCFTLTLAAATPGT
jgi:signal transduction histidine kinase